MSDEPTKRVFDSGFVKPGEPAQGTIDNGLVPLYGTAPNLEAIAHA
ncbi:hypothetical protein [Rhodoferax koreensis]|nr:hypothetical protein [Rhodoferax koreense]